MNDVKLDALYEAREQDELPAETPMTDAEMEAMHDYFNSPRVVSCAWESNTTQTPWDDSVSWATLVVAFPDGSERTFTYSDHDWMTRDAKGKDAPASVTKAVEAYFAEVSRG